MNEEKLGAVLQKLLRVLAPLKAAERARLIKAMAGFYGVAAEKDADKDKVVGFRASAPRKAE